MMVRAGVLSLAAIGHEVHAQTMLAGALVKIPVDGTVHFEDLQEVEVPVTKFPVEAQVLVQVAGSSVNPVDWKLITSDRAKAWSYPHIFGRDCAGTVVAVGDYVERLKVGDLVWADNASPEGCYAEYVLMEESITGLAPTTVPLAESALLPLVGLTGMQALNFGGLPAAKPNTIVVLGGSGGVGHVTLQIARAWAPEATIYTTCGTSNLEFCKKMGASVVVDYHVDDWQNIVPALSADIVFDTVGVSGTAELAYDVLQDGGTFVTIAGALAPSPVARSRPSVKQHFFLTDSSDYQQLDVLKELVDAGKLTPVLDETFPTAQIADAFRHSMGHHAVGKISVVPTATVTV